MLRLLATDLDGPDIAHGLIVSLNTVRTHAEHIYQKLGVNNRRAAIRRAKELDLLSRARDYLLGPPSDKTLSLDPWTNDLVARRGNCESAL